MSVNHGRTMSINEIENELYEPSSGEASPTLKDTPRTVSFCMQEDEHIVQLEQLCRCLNTNRYTGITCKYAKYLIKTYGENKYTRPGGNTSSCFVRKFLPGKSNTEWSKRDWDKVFNSRIDDEYSVIRDARKMLVRRRCIVRGDLIHLRQGQMVPADVRVIASDEHFCVDNRVITGNDLERKGSTSTSPDLLVSQNMIFAGTAIVRGDCEGIVLATGDQTVFAELTQFATKVRYVKNPSSRGSSLSSLSSGSSMGNSVGQLSLAGSMDDSTLSLQTNASLISSSCP